MTYLLVLFSRDNITAHKCFDAFLFCALALTSSIDFVASHSYYTEIVSSLTIITESNIISVQSFGQSKVFTQEMLASTLIKIDIYFIVSKLYIIR
jgi:hypothetical protein